MLGEIEYNDIFHPDDDDHQVYNKTALICVFFIFIFGSLIVTNMWVSTFVQFEMYFRGLRASLFVGRMFLL